MILAEYIQLVEPHLTRASDTQLVDNALGEVFRAEHLQYLKARNYSAPDVVMWSWILKGTTTYDAVQRMLAVQEDNRGRCGTDATPVPPFIPLFILRSKKGLSAKAYRLLLTHSLHLITGHASPTLRSDAGMLPDEIINHEHSTNTQTWINFNMCMDFISLLLDHARRLWPQAQLYIARVLAFYLSRRRCDSAQPLKNGPKAEMANSALRLLSLVPKIEPFAMASIQQQAQFEVLKAMAQHTPVLPVTRRGYHGIIGVQLRHKKTPSEQQFAELKALSWPPWKQEKLGTDFERGTEGMRSRAMQVMDQMRQAGYSQSHWEETAAVLAGWDTDRSPTIQTRAIMHRTPTKALMAYPEHPSLWIARIRATRTIREAWSCFLTYQDLGLPLQRSVCAAMVEKLVYREKTVQRGSDQAIHALPGDGPEVYAEPFSARDLIYVRTKPPTLDEFLEQMLSWGIRPSGRLLGLLLRHAPTYERGLEYISSSDLSNCQIRALCTVRSQPSSWDLETQEVLDAMPENVFSAFIEFLCNHSRLGTYSRRTDIRMTDTFPIIMGRRETWGHITLFSLGRRKADDLHRYSNIMSHAIRLVTLRKSLAPQPWILLLAGLNQTRTNGNYRVINTPEQLVLAWHELVEVLGWMQKRDIECGLPGFRILCQAFFRAVNSILDHPQSTKRALEMVGDGVRHGNLAHVDHVTQIPEEMVRNGLRILKHQFDQLVLPPMKHQPSSELNIDASQNDVSAEVTSLPMPHVPTPAVLHAFVRALGVAEDNDGILSLLQWMRQNERALIERSEESLGGERRLRRTIVAIRVFLERSWEKKSVRHSSTETSHDGDEKLIFGDPCLQDAYDAIEATTLGPWASDQEVYEYVQQDLNTR